MKTHFKTLILGVFFLITNFINAQEKMDRLGRQETVENDPVMIVRSNGNLLIASQTAEWFNGQIVENNILVVEYNVASGAIVRQAEFGQVGLDEKPTDLLEQPNGNILILGWRRGFYLHPNGTWGRQNGFLMRIKESTTPASSFSLDLARDIIPPAPLPPYNGLIVDYQVFPMTMAFDANGDVIVAGHQNEVHNSANWPFWTIHTGTQKTWLMRFSPLMFALFKNDETHNYGTGNPTQINNIMVLPDRRFLISGYVNAGAALHTAVTIMNNDYTAMTCTTVPVLNSSGTSMIYSNVYESALWRDQLILVGDYVITNNITNNPDPHDLVIAKADITGNNGIIVQTLMGYRHAASVGGTSNDGNLFNDFHDYRVAKILINGDDLIIIGIMRDRNQVGSTPPTFAEFCVMSVNLQTLKVNYNYVLSDMTNPGQNFANGVVVNRYGGYTFCGSKQFSLDKDIIIGTFTQNSKLKCNTPLEITSYPLNWIHSHPNIVIDNTTYGDEDLSMTRVVPTVAKSVECEASQPQCADAKDFVYYSDNSTIFTNTIWGTQGAGIKYYVDGTITVQNVTLDITNCDVIFGPCGKIVFTGNNARLRANNSVFRPCNDIQKWKGLVFQGGAEHRIIDCELKNAMTAIEITSSSANIEQIVDNTFTNNYIAINLSNAVLKGTITGNHFVINTPKGTYQEFECKPFTNPPTLQFYGIRATNSTFWSPIVSNEFVADDVLDPSINKTWEFYGISFNQSIGVIQANSFINNTASIFQTGNSTSQSNFLNKIDGNEIFLNRTVNNALTQIAIVSTPTNNINCLITNNTLINNRRLSTTTANYSGIYVESCNNAIVEKNDIEGFDIAININDCENPEVALNDIRGAYKTGIYVFHSEAEKINCNTIDLEYSNTDISSIGIFINECDQQPTISQVFSNCIFNTEIAIKVSGPAVPPMSNCPSVRNNFLYNYLSFGLLVGTNVTGNLGTPGIAAMNTFARNSNGLGVRDIENQNPPVFTAYGNFFQLAPIVGPTVVISGAIGTTHSVASCSHQTSGPNSTISGIIDQDFKCDANGAAIMNPNDGQGSGGEFTIGAGNSGHEFMDKQFLGFTGANAYGSVKNAVYLNALRDVFAKKIITLNTYYSCVSQYYQAAKDYRNALRFMDSVRVTSQLQEENHYIDIIRAKINGGLLSQIEKEEVMIRLPQIILEKNENYNQACFVYSLLTDQTGFRLNEQPDEKIVPSSRSLTMQESAQLLVYPNPVKTDLMIQVISSSFDLKGSGIVLYIHDYNGKNICTKKCDIVAGTIKLNVEGLSQGLYFANVVFSDKSQKTVKFIVE